MNSIFSRFEPRRANRRRPQRVTGERSDWLELAEAGILYFGVTLLPLLLAIVLYQLGWIG